MLHWCKTYVMRSSEMSLMTGPIKFQFFSLFGKAIRELCFAENPIKIRLRVPNIQAILSSWKQSDTKGIAYHNWMYLEINIIFPKYVSFGLITSHMVNWLHHYRKQWRSIFWSRTPIEGRPHTNETLIKHSHTSTYLSSSMIW